MIKVSAIIPTYNEAHNIADAIATVDWCDEILVVDSLSTDNTVSIAKNLGAKVLSHEYEHSAAQKNWTIPQAENEWIILLDADERLSENLIKEVKGILSQKEPDADAYWIHRDNYFLGRRIRFSGWSGDKVIRLFKRDLCKYEDKHVHAEIETSGRISFLKNKIIHNTYKDLNHYMNKVDKYTTRSAKDYLHKTKKVTFFHLWIKPSFRFVKHFFFQLGFLDGTAGLAIAKLSSYTVFQRYLKLSRLLKGEEL